MCCCHVGPFQNIWLVNILFGCCWRWLSWATTLPLVALTNIAFVFPSLATGCLPCYVGVPQGYFYFYIWCPRPEQVLHTIWNMELINSISCRSHQSKYMNRNSLEKGSFFVEQDINGLQLQAVFFSWSLSAKSKCKALALWKLTSGATKTKRKLIEEIFWWLFNYALLPWYITCYDI